MMFTIASQEELPNGTVLLTLHKEKKGEGCWTVICTTDGVSDRVINPNGKIITPGPVDAGISAELWSACAKALEHE